MPEPLPSTYYFFKYFKRDEWEIVRVDESGVYFTGTGVRYLTGTAKKLGTFGEKIVMPDDKTRRKI